MKKRIWSILITICLLLGMMPLTALAEESEYQTIMAGGSQLKGEQLDNVYLGTYMQSGNGVGRYNEDPIKWRILSNAGGKMYVVSDKILDIYPYNWDFEETTWETSSMRAWLNGHDGEYANDNFFDAAFSEGEQAKILDSSVVNGDAFSGATVGSNDTVDKMFLLSYDEVTNYDYKYGFWDASYRETALTAYSAAGGEMRTSMGQEGETCEWWLRTNVTKKQAAYVKDSGYVENFGNRVSTIYGVRPAMNINADKIALVSSAVGGKAATGMESGVKPIQSCEGPDWKLTLLDESRTFKASMLSKQGSKYVVKYENAATGPNEYISVVISDAEGNYTHYGRVRQLDGSIHLSYGSATIDLSGIDLSGKTVYVFNEQYNGGASDDNQLTDYASPLQALPIFPYAVTFNENHQDGSTFVMEAFEATQIEEPTVPTRDGFIFEGWFKNADLKDKWDFAKDKITGDVSLYAKWTPIEQSENDDVDMPGNVEDSVQDEPTQDEPVQDEPVKDEPVQDEPVQDEPVQDEPTQDEAAQDNEKPDSNVPETGDNSMMILWGIVLVMSVTVFGGVTYCRRKN